MIMTYDGKPQRVNLEAMKIWVDGLLSEEFEQGQGRLAYCEVQRDSQGNEISRGPIKACCLGVASILAARHGVDLKIKEVDQDEIVIYEFDGQRDFLPPSVQQWLGLLREPNPSIQALVTTKQGDEIDIVDTASGFNDGEVPAPGTGHLRQDRLPRLSFGQIANAIKRTYLRGEEDEETEKVS